MLQELEVIKFIKQHNEDWRDLLSGDPYYITIKEDDEFALLKYSQIDSDFNEPICRECRGLIIRKSDLKIMGLSFYKFFNFGEPFADRIHWKSCKTRQKIDGSKILVWYDGTKYRVSTSGALDAYKCPVGEDACRTFGDVFDDALKNNNLTFEQLTSLMDDNCCYTFELVSPESRIVIPYKTTDIYLIGVRNLDTLTEYEIEECSVAMVGGIKTPQLYDLSNAKAVIQTAEHMGYNEEGFVVVDKYFHRVKIKSPQYVLAHHIRMNGAVTESKVFDILERNEVNEFLTYFPEYREMFNTVKEKKETFKTELKQVLTKYKDKKDNWIGPIDRKAFVEEIMQNDKEFRAFIFKLLDVDLVDVFIDWQWSKLSRDNKLGYLGIKGVE